MIFVFQWLKRAKRKSKIGCTRGLGGLPKGKRILDTMKSGVCYGNAIFDEICNALPPDARAVLDFGAGAGFFADKFRCKKQ